MGAIRKSERICKDYDWHKQGYEWSTGVGNRHLVVGAIRPTMNAFVPTATLTVSTFLLAEDSQHETRCRRRVRTALGNPL